MRWLITGGSGVLGTQLIKSSAPHGINFINPTKEQVDILTSTPPHDLMSRLRGVIHCAAYTNVPGAETADGKRQAINLNINGTKNVKYWASVYGLPVVYISTDYVYAGDKGNYKETDRPRPINFYAATKLMGEAFMDPETDLIIRTSFKPDIKWPYPNAFDDLYSSADYVDIIADKILFLLHAFSESPRGIINVGTERKSIYSLARRRTTSVKPMSYKDIKNVDLPSDVSLDTTKYNEFYNYKVRKANDK